jgi:hypothetical protein
MSIPVWPCSRYSGPPKSKPRSTLPSAGQDHAAAGAGASTSANARRVTLVVIFVNIAATVAGGSAVVNDGYSERR